MKTKTLLAAMFLVLSGAVLSAAEPAGPGNTQASALQSEKANRSGAFAATLDEIDAIERPLLDLEARYWAWDIQNLGRTSYEDLQAKAKRWIIKPDTRDLLFKKMKAYLDAGKVPALTAEENGRLDKSKEQIRLILAPGKGDTKLIGTLSMDYCIDLRARYWAKRMQNGETEILENAKTKWPLTKDLRAKMVAAIEAKLKETNENLTKEELYKFDACGAKMHGRP